MSKETLVPIGSKLDISKPNNSILRAEILSHKVHSPESLFYVHYDGYNKRLDEWVPYSRLLLNTIELPKTASSVKKSSPSTKISLKILKRKRLSLHDLGKGKAQKQLQIIKNASAESTDTEAAVSSSNHPSGFSKEKEIEKLRTSGSMTQSLTEISRLKNIQTIQLGQHEIETWYFSPYPEEYNSLDLLYICEFCLEPIGNNTRFQRHRKKCTLKHPPGNEIYRNDLVQNISFFEIDGRKQRGYCRNLCLLSKLFLDHKTLYYDVDPFLFYLLVKTDNNGSHLIGYFSKEKLSADDYNVACILTLPQYQRMGFGKVLIEFSYELSKIELKTGSPEKPLSDLGLLSYRSYWADILLEKIVHFRGEIAIGDLSQMTSFTSDDILSTLQTMDVLRYYKGQMIICLHQKHLDSFEKNQKKTKIRIDPSKLDWAPPRFAPNQLRFL